MGIEGRVLGGQETEKSTDLLVGGCDRNQHFAHLRNLRSLVERRAQNCDYKMSEVRGAIVELKVARYTVIGEIFCYTRFGYAEMLSESWLEGLGAMAAEGAALKGGNVEAQSPD